MAPSLGSAQAQLEKRVLPETTPLVGIFASGNRLIPVGCLTSAVPAEFAHPPTHPQIEAAAWQSGAQRGAFTAGKVLRQKTGRRLPPVLQPEPDRSGRFFSRKMVQTSPRWFHVLAGGYSGNSKATASAESPGCGNSMAAASDLSVSLAQIM